MFVYCVIMFFFFLVLCCFLKVCLLLVVQERLQVPVVRGSSSPASYWIDSFSGIRKPPLCLVFLVLIFWVIFQWFYMVLNRFLFFLGEFSIWHLLGCFFCPLKRTMRFYEVCTRWESFEEFSWTMGFCLG